MTTERRAPGGEIAIATEDGAGTVRVRTWLLVAPAMARVLGQLDRPPNEEVRISRAGARRLARLLDEVSVRDG